MAVKLKDVCLVFLQCSRGPDLRDEVKLMLENY